MLCHVMMEIYTEWQIDYEYIRLANFKLGVVS